MTQRKIEHLALSNLSPDPRNPKGHSVETIDASVGRFGFLEPIVLDERTGHIISGHGRTKTLTAMMQRGETPPEGVLANAKGDWMVPVVTGWSSRTDTEAAAALIALNRSTEIGGWEDGPLLDLLDELADEGALAGVGFDDSEVAALRRHLDNLAMAEAANSGDLGEDPANLSDPVDLDGHLQIINVVIVKEHRADFYAAMLALPYVTDTRDAR